MAPAQQITNKHMKLKENWVEVPAGVGTSKRWTVKPGYYEVSSFGRIRNKKTKKLLGEGNYRTLITVKGDPYERLNILKSHLVYGSFKHCSTFGEKIYHLDGDEHNNAIWNLATYADLKEMRLV